MKTIPAFAFMALLASASAAQPPLLVTGTPGPSAIVSYGDLNLSSKSGQERLSSRIRAAARDICLEDNVEAVKVSVARRHCFNMALKDGFRQMDQAIAANGKGATIAAATLVVRGE